MPDLSSGTDRDTQTPYRPIHPIMWSGINHKIHLPLVSPTRVSFPPSPVNIPVIPYNPSRLTNLSLLPPLPIKNDSSIHQLPSSSENKTSTSESSLTSSGTSDDCQNQISAFRGMNDSTKSVLVPISHSSLPSTAFPTTLPLQSKSSYLSLDYDTYYEPDGWPYIKRYLKH